MLEVRTLRTVQDKYEFKVSLVPYAQDNFEEAASLFIGEEQLKGVFLFLLLRAFLSCDRSWDVKKGLNKAKTALFINVLEYMSIVML